MKKTILLIFFILLLLFFSTNSIANLSVQPIEISIDMQDEFISGNTSKIIVVTSNYDCDCNVTWYKEHPDPIEWIRPNRTKIPNLSWIDVQPKWQIIPPGVHANFYIYTNVPKNEETISKNWETWITFKMGGQEHSAGPFNREYAVRVYIDTPESIENENALPGVSTEDQVVPSIHTAILIFIICIILLLLLVVLLNFKSKKNS